MWRKSAARGKVSPDPWGLPDDGDDQYVLEEVEHHPPPPPPVKSTAKVKDTAPLVAPVVVGDDRNKAQRSPEVQTQSHNGQLANGEARQGSGVKANGVQRSRTGSTVVVVTPVKEKSDFHYQPKNKEKNGIQDEYSHKKFNSNHAWTPFLHERKR